jgi:hypothetical protein
MRAGTCFCSGYTVKKERKKEKQKKRKERRKGRQAGKPLTTMVRILPL